MPLCTTYWRLKGYGQSATTGKPTAQRLRCPVKTMTKTMLKGETDRATSMEASIVDPNATVALTGEQGCEAACPSNQQPPHAGDAAIRELSATANGKRLGCPAGDGLDFWLEAEREVNATRSGSGSAQG